MTQVSSRVFSLCAVRSQLLWLLVILILANALCAHITVAFSFHSVAKYVAKPWCLTRECCHDEAWVNRTNSTGLRRALKTQLFGQHLVTSHVFGAVDGHLTDSNPSKPLVLSFHGRTGTGKNFVARLIAESIYKEGMSSQFVHLFSANSHFPHKKNVDEYKDKLRHQVSESVASCPYQLFIFDEIEDMPQGLLDSIKPFLDYNIHIDNVDYRKAIFIFLSNAASMEITSKTSEHLTQGGSREDITLKEMEEIIELAAFNTGGGFNQSRLIDNYVISHFVPFLPLERRHVRDCIRTALRKRHHSHRANEVAVDNVLAHLQFVPKDAGLFALKGCKNVEEKVTLVLHQMRKEL